MAHRPLVTVNGAKKHTTLPLPDVFISPLRNDIVQYVHTNLSKNKRQPYAVNKYAGMNHSAESWGTGRAVSRIPRVSGGGTHRAGQGAFGNMCRKGRMFAPTKLYRRWHRKVNKNQKRFAICSALAATAVPALVMAKGHRISGVPEIPLVLADGVFDGVTKTKAAWKILQTYKVDEDINQVKNTRRIRAGKGKARNRRHIAKRGPLVIHNGENKGMLLSLRNIPGIKLINIHKLNLLQLAPGGQLGRFVIWTESAFKAINKVFGSFTKSSQQKPRFRPPQAILYNPDVNRIINSEEVKAVLKPRSIFSSRIPRKRNPLKNWKAMMRLNPYAAAVKKRTLKAGIRQLQKNRRLKIQKANPQKKELSEQSKKLRTQRAKKLRAKNKRLANATKEWKKILLTPAVAPQKSADEAAGF